MNYLFSVTTNGLDTGYVLMVEEIKINGKEILKKLQKAINIRKQIYVVERKKGDAFEKLVAIILSQNTNDINAKRALTNLIKEIGLKSEKISKADLKEIEKAIKPAGLYKQKAKRIKDLAMRILNGLNLEEILSMEVEEARKELMKIPGIGPKTADVFLAIYGHKTFGIDTHINRIVRRIGLVSENATYEEIRRTLMRIFEGLDYDLVHRYFIAHGRIFCTAKKPKCEICPLRDICKYAKSQNTHE